MSFQKSTALTTAAQRAVVSIADAELILIVDCSSSMSPHVLPVYTGLNELLTMQGKLPGKTRITLVLFNDSPTIIYANARLTDTSTPMIFKTTRKGFGLSNEFCAYKSLVVRYLQ